MAMLGKLRRRRFGEILVGDGLIGHEELEEALEIQRECGDTLGAILLDLGHIVETDIVKALSIQYQLPCLRPSNYEIDRKLLDEFDPVFLHRHLVLPFDRIGNLLLVLLQDIPTRKVLEEVQQVAACDLAIYLGPSSEIKQVLTAASPISEVDEEKIRESRIMAKERHEDEAAASRPDVAKLESPDSMDLSSENLLSSLDAAWDSIFVESTDGESSNED